MPKHIARLILMIFTFGAAALIAKSYFTPDSFYDYGHYRGDSVPEIASQDPVFQTAGYCKTCHEARVAMWSANNHKTVICEVCHGAAKGHPANGKLPIPADSRKLCTLCHEAMAGRPSTQPQIDVALHSGGRQCIVCHNPHAPKIAAVAAQVAGDATAGKAAAGKALAKNCAACHGETGIAANPAWPTIAGQKPGYLVNVLKAFRAGLRKDPTMAGVARALSDADIADLAAYFAAQSCEPALQARRTP